jgi:hypothetical protein
MLDNSTGWRRPKGVGFEKPPLRRSEQGSKCSTVRCSVSATGGRANLGWEGSERLVMTRKRSLAWVARQRIGGLQKGHSGSVECNPYSLTRNAVDISAWLRELGWSAMWRRFRTRRSMRARRPI